MSAHLILGVPIFILGILHGIGFIHDVKHKTRWVFISAICALAGLIVGAFHISLAFN